MRADQLLSTEQTKVGDAFTATVWTPVVPQNGDVIVPRSAKIYGKVVGTHHLADASHRAVVQLDFDGIEFLGKRYPFDATVIDVSKVVERSKTTGAIVQRPDTIAVGFITGAVITGSDLRTSSKPRVSWLTRVRSSRSVPATWSTSFLKARR